MRKILKSLLFLFLFVGVISGCAEQSPDCFQASGETVNEELELPEFENIIVFERVRLILVQGQEQKVELQTGRNLRPEISAEVSGGVLELRNENSCNLFRDYGQTVFRITHPNLRSIRSSTGLTISSEGTLSYDSLELFSESFLNPETETTDGAFDLDLAVEQLSVVSNNIAFFNLRGTVEMLRLNIAAGDSRIDARSLRADTVIFNHRGTNDMLVNPSNRIEGTLRGTGDVRSFNRPPEVAVETLFSGRLIFED